MAKQLNVNLAFTADTSQAKKQLQDLQNQLTKLTSFNLGDNKGQFKITKEVQEASKAAAQLKAQLENATNVNTGKLDLGKFKEAMDQSGMSITKYREQLSALGPAGNKAFMSLADSIMNAEIPLRRTNKLMDEFWVSLKNTARWQISSSVLHGLMGAIQGAYGYAQDLNKSLTSIAIVTHNSVDNMRQFANQANKSAQALSVSTLAYTDAALIYYQQGLQGEDVARRVETTLKLSNVTGESATEISSYMTAIWNNFAKGSDNLELFADKITALGAATASSSSEIAGGLQQFAAVANTVGLSYDYAATALATVVAQTRQSESTVGNAFRTIFSRLEGLQMGETLEDGTTLNKYSKALETVGVSIKDQNGELKQMDTILDEIGAKWEVLSRDQQMALAQTIGGVRQYANLIALFDNWDKFQQNLTVTQNAEGELEKQAIIYGDSWEAAQKRVQAAWQAIYQDLISDKFFITILKSLEKILNFIDKIIDSAGGLKTVFFGLATAITTAFGPQISKSITDFAYGVKMMTPEGKEAVQNLRQKAINEAAELSFDGTTMEGAAQSTAIQQRAQLQQVLLDNAYKMSEEELKYNQILLDGNKVLQERYINASKKVDDLKTELTEQQNILYSKGGINKNNFNREDSNFLKEAYFTMSQRSKLYNELSKIEDKSSKEYHDIVEKIEQTKIDVSKFSKIFGSEEDANAFLNLMPKTSGRGSNNQRSSLTVAAQAEDLFEKYKEHISSKTKDFNEEEYRKFIDILKELGIEEENIKRKEEELSDNTNFLSQTMARAGGNIATFGDSIVNAVRGLNMLATGLSIVNEAIDTWNSKDLTFMEKFTSTLPQLAMGLPMLVNGFKTLKGVITGPILKGLKDFWSLLTGVFTKGWVGIKALAAAFSEFLLPILAVVAALVVLKKAYDEWYASTPEGKIKAAREELEKANEALSQTEAKLSEITQNYENLNKVLDSYDKHVENLRKFEEGSRDWNRAIVDNNTELLNTLDTLKLLDEVQYKTDENGMYYIDENDREKVLDKAAQQQALQNISALQARVNVAEKETKVLIASLTKDLKRVELENATSAYKILDTGGSNAVNVGDIISEASVKSLERLGYNLKYEESSEKISDFIDTTDQKIDFLADFGKQLADTGWSGDGNALKEAIDDASWKDKLEFLTQIPDLRNRQDILDAIAAAADRIAGTDKTSDAYKAEMGRELAQALHIELPKYATDKTYIELYNGLIGNKNNNLQKYADILEKGQTNYNDLEEDEKIIYDNALKAFAKSREGIEFDTDVRTQQGKLKEGDTVVTSKFDVDDIAREYLLSTLTLEDLANDSELKQGIQNNIKKDRELIVENYREAFKNAFGSDRLLNSLSDDELGFLRTMSDTDASYIHTEDQMKEYLSGKVNESNQNYKNPDLNTEELTQYKSTKAGIADLNEDITELTKHIRDHADEIDGLSSRLSLFEEEAKDVAEAIVRFDDAIQDVTENYNTWLNALNNGAVENVEEAIEGMRIAYANLLDTDGSDFSDTFLKTTKNLELMQAAIQGNQKAYNDLLYAAAEDYLQFNVGLAPDSASNIIDQYQQLLADCYPNFDNIEVGAELNDANFIAGLEGMINAVARTKEEAERILMKMGVNATVVEDTSRTRDQVQQTGWDADWEDVSSIGGFQAPTIGSDGEVKYNKADYHAKALHITPQTITEEEEKSFTGFALKIDSATKSAGGNVKHQQATHGGGGVSPKKSGGGGGGGNKKKTTKEHTKPVKNEDRYHNIKSAIDAVSKSLARLDKLKDRAYGKSKLKYMDQEIDKLKEQVKLTDMYINEAKKYLALDKQKVDALGLGAVYDTDGRLVNYEQLLQGITRSYNDAIGAYNGAIDQFNASAQEDADNQILDNAKKQLDKAKEVYDDNQKILKQYEDSYKTVQEQMDKRVELLNEIYDRKLAKVVWKVDIQLEVNDADLEFLQWMNKYIEKDFRKGADAIANLSKQMQDFSKNIGAVQGGLAELFSNHGIGDINNMTSTQLVEALQRWQDIEGLGSELTEDEAKQIREWMKSLMDYADSMLEAFEQAHKKVDQTLDDWNDRLDRQMKYYDDYIDLIEHYNDIIGLTGQRILDLSSDDMMGIDRARINTSQRYLESLREIRETNEKALNDLLAIDTSGYSEDALREHQKNIEHAEDAVREARQNEQSQFQKSLEDAKTAYDNALDYMVDEYKKTLGELDYLRERFSRQQEVDHLYLDDYEKYHELNKDMKDLQDSLDKTNNLALKSKLKDFQDELNAAMQNGVKISERQAEVYAKRVALLQAEAQLLDAQNAKSAVRMTRDNEGNFSYTYTADQDAIGEARNNYADRFYEYQKYLIEQTEQIQSEHLEKEAQYTEDLRNLYEMYYNGQIDDLDAALAELNAQYDEYNAYYLDQLNFVMDEEKRLRDEDWQFAEEMTGLKLANEDDFITQFEETIVGRLAPQYESMEQMSAEWAQAIITSNQQAQQALRTWYNDVKTTYAAAGQDVNTFRDTMLNDFKSIDTKSQETKIVTHDLAQQMASDMGAVIQQAANMDRVWSQVMADMRRQIMETVYKMNDMLAQLANIEGYEYRAGTAAQVMEGAWSAAAGAAHDLADGMRDAADGVNKLADAVDRLNNGPTVDPDPKTKDIQYYDYRGIPVDRSYTGQKYIGTNRGLQPVSGATGMYTGAWGSEGKLAILHEKELVLNKEDTSNILSVVDMVRGIASKFDLSEGMNGIAKSILGSSQLAMAGAGALDQNVHIEASFPNVQSHNEIELALNNLINSASQYVNRK